MSKSIFRRVGSHLGSTAFISPISYAARVQGLLLSTAITAITITALLPSTAAADMTFNHSLSRWGTSQTGADQVGTGGFYSFGNDPTNRVFTTSAPTGMVQGLPVFEGSTRVFVGGSEASVPQAAGIHSFAFGNMGVVSSPTAYQEVENYNLSATTGQISDLNNGDYAKLVFDVTNDQDLNYLAAMGNIESMSIVQVGAEAAGNKQVTVVMQIVDTVASAADPTGDIVTAAGALSFSMDRNAAGTAQSLTPNQGKTIFQTDFFYQDLTIPTLDPTGKTVAIRADGVLGVEGTFTALIPEATIAAVGLDPQSVGGSSDAGIPDGFSFSQNGAQTINGQTYYSYSIKNSAWSEHDLQFGQSTGNTVIDTIIADQGTPYSLVKEGTGTLSLTGDNTFTGGVTLAGGTLSLQHDNAAGTGDITTTGSTVDYADGVNISNPLNINSNTTKLQVLTGSAEQSGVISETAGPRPIEKIGPGTLTLSTANTYSGTTTITQGTLVAGAAGSLGATNSDVVVNGGTLDLGGMYHTKQDVVQTAGTIQNGGLTLKTYARTGGTSSVTISANVSVIATGGTVTTIGTGGVEVDNTTSNLTQTYNRVAINNSTGVGVDTHATGSGGISNSVYGTVSGINTGILSRATTGNIDINVGRNVSSSGNSALGGSTYNTVASAIWAETSSGEINIHGTGDVTSTGNGSRTINVITTDTNANSSNDVIIDMSGTITNSGTGPGGGLYTRGIYVDRRTAGSGAVEITTGDINITNATNGNASAVSASQSGSGSFSIDTTAGTLTLNGTATAGALIGVNAGSSGSGGVDIKSGKIDIIGGTNNSSYGGIGILASTSSAGAPIDIETFDTLNGGQGGIRVFGLGSSGATGDVTINTRAKIGDATQPTDYGIQLRAENGATKIHLGQHADGTLVASGAADLKTGGIGILTEIKGSGSLEIDTRSQTITAGDIGIRTLQHNGGQIDINTGTVNGTGHGIIVHAGTGIKNITTHGAVVGGGYGIAAENSSGTGKVTVTANAGVSGQTQSGISVATGTGDIAINSTSVIEGFNRAINTETSSGAISIVNSGAATTTSTGSDAYTVYARQTGTGSTSNGITINQTGEVNNSGSNSTRGIHALRYAAGAGTVSVTSGDVNITSVSNGNVAAIQAHQDNAANTGKVIVDSTAGTLTVNGTSNPYALFGITAGNYGSGGIDIDSGVIVLNGGSGAPSGSGYSGVGIFASTGNNGIQNSSITIDTHGTISGGWKGIQAISRADNSNIDIVTNDVITTTNMGIEASNGFLHTGAVENAALTGAIHVTNKASIGNGTTSGNPEYGIVVRGGNGSLEVDVDGAITVARTGVYAQTEGNGILDIDSTGQTIIGGSEGINVNIHKGAGQIDIVTGTTTGTSNEAIKVHVGTGIKNITTHGATTGGTYGINAVNSSATGKVTIIANANVAGQSQRGINVVTGSGDVDVSSSAGTIQGQTNGLVATTTSGNINIDLTGNVVGVNGDALAGLSTSGNVVVTGSGDVTGNYRAISTNTKGNITISGTGKSTVNGPGINANNVGAITATIGTVTANSTILITRSGAVSNLSNQNVKGIYANNSSTGAGDIKIANDNGTGTYGSIVIDGNSNSASVGIYAERHNATTGGDVIIDTGAVTVNGTTGFGIEGLGYDASNVNITNHGAVNGGHIGIGGFTYGTGNVTIETDADIGDLAAPSSYAILARADGSGDVSITANNAVVSAGTAISADNLSNGGSGNVTISGAGAVSGATRAITAQTNGGSIAITGSGDVTASGANSISINAKSTSGGANDLTINRTGAIINTGSGNSKGIVAQHLGVGSGDLNITTGADGITVGGQSGVGISAYRDATSSGSGGVNIDTRAGTIAINGTGDGGGDFGSTDGIAATMVSNGTGKISINSGAITTSNISGRGIFAYTASDNSDIDIITHGVITGGRIGIEATNGHNNIDTSGFVTLRNGDIKITTNAEIGAAGASNLKYGIVTRSGNGSVKIDANANITADNSAILAQVKGSGSVDIDINAAIFGTSNGIEFDGSSTGDLNLKISSQGEISGEAHAILSAGGGKVTLTNAGEVKGQISVTGSDTATSHFQNSGTWDAFGGASIFDGSVTNAGTFNLQNGVANDTFSTRDFELTNNSFLKIDVDNANRADKFNVTGTVSLAGTLDVKANGLDTDYVRGDDYEYTLITNDGTDSVSGAFDTVETNFAFLTPTVNTASGDGNDVTLSLHAKNDRPDFKPHAKGAQQFAVATAIDGIAFDNKDGEKILDAVEGITTTQASEALNQFGGGDHASSNAMGKQSFQAFNQVSMARRGSAQGSNGGDTASSAFGYASFGTTKPAIAAIGDVEKSNTTRTELWGRMFASRASVDGSSNTPSLNSQNSGVAFGGDIKDPYLDAVMGISFGYSNSNFSTNVAGSSSKSENYHLGAYGFFGASASNQIGLGLLSAVNFSRQNYTTKRALTIGGLDRLAVAKYSGDTYGADLRLRYGFNPNAEDTDFVFAPIAGMDFSSSSNDAYSETGAGTLNLTSAEINTIRYGSQLGFEMSNKFEINSMPGAATLSVGWHHEFGDVNQISTYSFAGSPTQFTNASPAEARDRLKLTGGLQFETSQNSTLSFSGTFENSQTSQQMGGGVSVKFKF